MNTYLTVSSLLNFLAAVLQILILLASSDRSRIRSTYLIFLAFIAAWSANYYLWRIAETHETALLYSKWLIAAAAFEPIAFFHFCISLSGIKATRSILFGYAGALAMVAMTPWGWIVRDVEPILGHSYWPMAGQAMPYYLLLFNGYLIASWIILYRGWKRNIGGKASDFLIVLFSSLIGFTGGGTNFPLWYEIPIQPYGNILVSVYLFLLIHGLYHNRMFGLSLDFYKTLTALTLNGSVALFYLLFLALYKSLHGYEILTQHFLIQGAAAYCISIVAFWGIPRLKFWTESILDGVFRKEHAGRLSRLNELPVRLSEQTEKSEIFKLVADTLHEVVDVSGVSIFYLENFQRHYSCVATSGRFADLSESYRIDAESPIIEGLIQSPRCLVLGQIHIELAPAYSNALAQLKNDLNTSVIIPIYGNREIFGLILLNHPESNKLWSDEEISALFNVGTQIGLNLHVRELERVSNEEKKLVALGTMAAGLAHEIRNPLVSVQTLAYTLKSGKKLNELPEEFKNTILRDIKRIGNIVEGVASYSQNQQGKRSRICIVEVIESSISIYRESLSAEQIELKFEKTYSQNLAVQANFDQLQQVINNLIENAIHALSGIQSPRIHISITQREVRANGGYQWIEVTVEDNGVGVPVNIRERIFDPFITSKDTGDRVDKKGMGLGLAISKRIIENHQGALNVYNNPTGGARFVVSLKAYNQ